MSEPISEGRALYLSGLRREKRTVLFLRAALLLMIFLMWELAADVGAIDSFIFSCPSRMWETFVGLLSSGDLFIHVGTSVAETTAGFLLGTACGITAAIAARKTAIMLFTVILTGMLLFFSMAFIIKNSCKIFLYQ